jgi:hypothetical protein
MLEAGPLPDWVPWQVEEDVDGFVADRLERMVPPKATSGERCREFVLGEPADIAALERVGSQLAPDRL